MHVSCVYNVVFSGKLIITSYRNISFYMGVPVLLLLNNSEHRNQSMGGEAIVVAIGGE